MDQVGCSGSASCIELATVDIDGYRACAAKRTACDCAESYAATAEYGDCVFAGNSSACDSMYPRR